MAATIIDGKQQASHLRESLKKNIIILTNKGYRSPCLATILVGDDPASHIYVRNKRQYCNEVGIKSHHIELPASTSEKELLEIITQLNQDDSIDGILVQLPLPRHINSDTMIKAIDFHKDVDGFHPYNAGLLSLGSPQALIPCTPQACLSLIKSCVPSLAGLHAVVVGRSSIVGRPLAQLLLSHHATVTVCHSHTRHLAAIVRQADIIVAAVGKKHLIQGDWVKPGAIVIDVGINRLDDGRLVGDVDFAAAAENASFITPVPGGVGPMTITMLLYNTTELFCRQHHISFDKLIS
jgi:methylenetetrahydrofolate dehydrogenase (NADP+)/methenyltetrahydrofolate cyclohydrolase